MFYFAGRALSEYIGRYEVLKYDPTQVHYHHHRIKRSLSNQYEPLSIRFHSHGRYFHLRLKRDTTTISPNVQIEMPAHLGELDTSHIYEGTLSGENLKSYTNKPVMVKEISNIF